MGKNENLEIKKQIGEGATAKVHLATMDGRDVCAKIITNTFYSSSVGKKFVDNEITIMKGLKHKNILELVGEAQHKTQKVILTELCVEGDLYQKIKKTKPLLESSFISHVMSQVIEGYQYLVNNQIIHRDLKPQNILLAAGGVPKIADFGFAIRKGSGKLQKANAGSPLYMAPESLQGNVFSTQSDIFALGVIWYQMLHSQTPWRASSQAQLLHKIKQQKPIFTAKCDINIKNIILNCLNPVSNARPSVETLLALFKNPIQQTTKNNLSCKNGKGDTSSRSTVESQTQQLKSTQSIASIPNLRIPLSVIDKNSIKGEPKILKQGHNNNNKTMMRNRAITVSCQLQNNNQISNFTSLINPCKMKYIPTSYIIKLQYILTVLAATFTNYKTQKPKLPKQLNHDSLCKQIDASKTENAMCKYLLPFARHLLKLAEYHSANEVPSLLVMYNHVQTLASA